MDDALITQLAEQARDAHGAYAYDAVLRFFNSLGSPQWIVVTIPVQHSEGIVGNFADSVTITAIAARIEAMLAAAERAGFNVERPWESGVELTRPSPGVRELGDYPKAGEQDALDAVEDAIKGD